MQKCTGYQGAKYWHVFSNWEQSLVFFTDNNFHLSDHLHDDEFLTQLVYLGNVFSHLNDLNRALQGLSATIFNVREKIETMINKLELFSVCINKGNTQVFPSLYDFVFCVQMNCQMWCSEWVGCAITQVHSRNGWHKQLDSLTLSCPASSPLTDIWTREPHRNSNKRSCENWI